MRQNSLLTQLQFMNNMMNQSSLGQNEAAKMHHQQASAGALMRSPLQLSKDLQNQLSPSAIIDSPSDNYEIKQPNTSQVNSFQQALQQQPRANQPSATGQLNPESSNKMVAGDNLQNCTSSKLISKRSPASITSLQNIPNALSHGQSKHQTSQSEIPGQLNSSKTHGLQQIPSSNQVVGSSLAKKHLHYFKSSATVTSANTSESILLQQQSASHEQHSSVGGVKPPQPHHKISQSGQITQQQRERLFQASLLSPSLQQENVAGPSGARTQSITAIDPASSSSHKMLRRHHQYQQLATWQTQTDTGPIKSNKLSQIRINEQIDTGPFQPAESNTSTTAATAAMTVANYASANSDGNQKVNSYKDGMNQRAQKVAINFNTSNINGSSGAVSGAQQLSQSQLLSDMEKSQQHHHNHQQQQQQQQQQVQLSVDEQKQQLRLSSTQQQQRQHRASGGVNQQDQQSPSSAQKKQSTVHQKLAATVGATANGADQRSVPVQKVRVAKKVPVSSQMLQQNQSTSKTSRNPVKISSSLSLKVANMNHHHQQQQRVQQVQQDTACTSKGSNNGGIVLAPVTRISRRENRTERHQSHQQQTTSLIANLSMQKSQQESDKKQQAARGDESQQPSSQPRPPVQLTTAYQSKIQLMKLSANNQTQQPSGKPYPAQTELSCLLSPQVARQKAHQTVVSQALHHPSTANATASCRINANAAQSKNFNHGNNTVTNSSSNFHKKLSTTSMSQQSNANNQSNNNNQKSTKILRKHVNFEVQKSSLQHLSTTTGQDLKQMRHKALLKQVGPAASMKQLSARQKFIQKSMSLVAGGSMTSATGQLLKNTAATQQESKEKEQTTAEASGQTAAKLMLRPMSDQGSKPMPDRGQDISESSPLLPLMQNINKVTSKRPPTATGLEIEIPLSPQPTAQDQQDQSNKKKGSERKQTQQISQVIRQIEIPDHRGRNTLLATNSKSQNAILKISGQSQSSSQNNRQINTSQQPPSSSQNTNLIQVAHQQPQLLNRQIQSPVLESIQASQTTTNATSSSIAANTTAKPAEETKQQSNTAEEIRERPLQVYRPNCQSTRHLPNKGSQILQGCVPSTTPTGTDSFESSTECQEAAIQASTANSNSNNNDNNRLPPAPQSNKHQQSRSQSGIRQHTNATANGQGAGCYDSIRQDSMAHKQSSPLAQYANYAFQPACKILLPPHLTYESSKTSVRRNGVVRGYAANTHQGLIRNYNEDRVSIILNISEPETWKNQKLSSDEGENSPWPVCSFFGIYDGHGGSQCADFLRDNLHQYVVKESCFPDDPREAIKLGFVKAERIWTEQHATKKDEEGQTQIVDRSGSCAIVIIIIEEMCYVANVGDSRAVLSGDAGKRVFALSRDHKPSDEHEKQRIIKAGGKIYSRQIPSTTKNQLPPSAATNKASSQSESNNAGQEVTQNANSSIQGPERIFPGRLSVSRSFGDVEAKLIEFGGNPNVLIATPEIKAFRIKKEHDFIVLGCDGIFDRMNNKEAINVIWKSTEDLARLYPNTKTVHQLSGLGVDYILKNSLLRRSLDNVTSVLVAFRNFKHAVFGDDEALVGGKAGLGSNHPNTTKAAPQANTGSKDSEIVAATMKDPYSAKVDARSNSQSIFTSNRNRQLQQANHQASSAQQLLETNSTASGAKHDQHAFSTQSATTHQQQHVVGRISSQRALLTDQIAEKSDIRANQALSSAKKMANSSESLQTPLKLGSRIDNLINRPKTVKQPEISTMPRSTDKTNNKVLKRQLGQEGPFLSSKNLFEESKRSTTSRNLAPLPQSSSDVLTSLSQRALQQRNLIDQLNNSSKTYGQNTTNSKGINNNQSKHEQKPYQQVSNNITLQASSSSLGASSSGAQFNGKIPQLVSRESLKQKLAAKKFLQKSQSSGPYQPQNFLQGEPSDSTKMDDGAYSLAPTPGLTNSSQVEDQSGRVPTDTKILQLKAQTKKKHTMPRFFKFEESTTKATAGNEETQKELGAGQNAAQEDVDQNANDTRMVALQQ